MAGRAEPRRLGGEVAAPGADAQVQRVGQALAPVVQALDAVLDGAGRIATAQRNHAPPPAHRQWRHGQQVARQIDHVAQVVAVAQTLPGKGDECIDLLR